MVSTISQINRQLRCDCSGKSFTVACSHCQNNSSSAAQAVDLVVVIDTSDSMRDEAKTLSKTVKTVIDNIKPSCAHDLRIVSLGIEGSWSKTQFEQSVRSYLNDRGISNSDICGRRVGTVPNQGAQEDGARTIIDLTKHFDWRRGALRLILYLGDEALEGGDPHTVADIKAAREAVAIAKAQAVKVFTYAGTGSNEITPDSKVEIAYRRLAAATGAVSYSAPMENLYHFGIYLEEIICRRDQSWGGQGIAKPDIAPCFELRWGDEQRDRIETDDVEVLYLIARNPYSNITLKHVSIVLSEFTHADGKPIPILPDGTSAVAIKPANFIYFGDLPPYQSNHPDAEGIARSLTLTSRGMVAGDYRLHIEYRYGIGFELIGDSDDCVLELVAS